MEGHENVAAGDFQAPTAECDDVPVNVCDKRLTQSLIALVALCLLQCDPQLPYTSIRRIK